MTPPRYIVVDVAQRSAAWHQARVGRLTGSRAADMLTQIKSGESAYRANLRAALVCERLTGLSVEDSYISRAMERGILLEPQARAAYALAAGVEVREVGFLQHVDMSAGASPDGVVGDGEGLLEIKCPDSTTHLSTLRGESIPKRYLPQLRHALWVSGARWIDFASYDDRFPVGLDLWTRRLTAEDAQLEEYDVEARRFLAEVAREVETLRARVAPQF